MPVDAALLAFRDVVRGADHDIDLAAAALAVARVEHPDLDPAGSLARLDALAARAAGPGLDPAGRLAHLRRVLFEEERFRGNAADYYDPRNSCLNDVLDRRLGIPITLSLLTMEVGRRVGLRIEGIGLPGHFVVSVHVGERPVLLDPFDGGATLTPARASEVVSAAVGRPVELVDAHWTPCSKRQVLIRMLRNLKTVYVQRDRWDRALAVIDRLLVLDGDSPVHLRDRGTVLVKLGRLHEGAREWDAYLSRFPGAQDAEGFRRQLRRVRTELAARN